MLEIWIWSKFWLGFWFGFGFGFRLCFEILFSIRICRSFRSVWNWINSIGIELFDLTSFHFHSLFQQRSYFKKKTPFSHLDPSSFTWKRRIFFSMIFSPSSSQFIHQPTVKGAINTHCKRVNKAISMEKRENQIFRNPFPRCPLLPTSQMYKTNRILELWLFAQCVMYIAVGSRGQARSSIIDELIILLLCGNSFSP